MLSFKTPILKSKVKNIWWSDINLRKEGVKEKGNGGGANQSGSIL